MKTFQLELPDHVANLLLDPAMADIHWSGLLANVILPIATCRANAIAKALLQAHHVPDDLMALKLERCLEQLLRGISAADGRGPSSCS